MENQMTARSVRKCTHSDSRFTVSFETDGIVPIDAGRARFLHGPAVVRCTNGDWLAAYQDAHDDPGRNSIVRQKRSRDGGRSWEDEGIVYDEDARGFGARNPAFGLARDGAILMAVQRVGLKRLGHVRGENIVGSVSLVSQDHGKTYQSQGLIDSGTRFGHQGCSTHIVERDGLHTMAAFHHKGLAIYTSHDDGRTWPERTVAVSEDEMPESPRYPTIVFRPDGSLLLLGHLNRSVRCFRRVSDDLGKTWGPVEICPDVDLRHPVLLYAGETLLCLGRMMDVWKTGLSVSGDHGETWSDAIDIAPERGPGGGYTALWPTRKPGEVFAAFSADGEPGEAQDILGMTLRNFRVARRRSS